MLLGTLGAILLENILAGKGIELQNWLYELVMDLIFDLPKKSSFPCSSIIEYCDKKYFQYEIRFNGVYSRDNLTKIKDRAYVINLKEYSDIGTHWIALYVQNNDATYFDSFGVEHIPKEIRTFIGNKNIKTNIFRIQAYDSIMCRYYSLGFINFMLAKKTLNDITNLFFTK